MAYARRARSRLGYVEGTNLVVDRYSADGRFNRFPEIAHEVVATQPDVICAMSNPLVLALKSETRTIPIVAWTSDPIAAGIVSNLARPGGNVTGVSIDAGLEVVSKRVEPLHPPINEAEYRRAFEAMQRDHVDGVYIAADSENYTHRVLLGQLAKQYRLPAICWYSDSVRAGALMSHAFDLKSGASRVAAQIVEILNGGKPAQMPYFQETHFELVINLKAAKELGLEIPSGLVASADALIE